MWPANYSCPLLSFFAFQRTILPAPLIGYHKNLRAIFNRRSDKDAARLNLAKWYNRVGESGFKSFNTIAATFYEHSGEILNFYDNRSTNASAESINSKIKAFRAKLHGVNDTKFFIFCLCNWLA